MRRFILAGLVGLIALFALLALKVDAKDTDAESNQKSRPKWEYKTLDCYDEKELAKMGNEGWEMVAVAATVNKWEFGFSTADARYGEGKPKLSESTGATGEMKGYGGCLLYLKRQK